jgi:hypothetical protein
MRIRPNRCELDAEVLALRRCADGHGAELELRALGDARALEGDEMTGARSGDTLTVFAAVPEAVAAGGRYRLELSVLGGPAGERIVAARVQPLGTCE